MMVGGAVVNALAFTGGNYLFSLLGDKSAEGNKAFHFSVYACELVQ